MTSFSFQPDEFIVEEIIPDGRVLEVDKPFVGEQGEGTFCHFVMQKRQWNTAQALGAIARALHTTHKRFNAAGTKDRNAVTVQLCSAFSLAPQKLMAVDVKDIKVLGAWNAADKVKMGALLGNRFTITLNKENCGKDADAHAIEERAKKLGYRIPNYFGEQRFGSLRHNTHLVGKLLVKGLYKEAVMNFLTYTDEHEKGEGKQARERLDKEGDFGAALGYYPYYLKYERTVLAHLHQHENDFIGALRKLPRPTLLMFVHAYQSQLFNLLLERRVKDDTLFKPLLGDWWCAADKHGFPLFRESGEAVLVDKINSNTAAAKAHKLVEKGEAFLLGNLVGSESQLTKEEEQLLEDEGITQQSFVLKSLPELSSRGTFRPMFVPLKEFEVFSKDPAKIRFALPAGAYATVALRELLA